MSRAPENWDPELEAILQEVASDPKSTLLRVKRSDVFRTLEDRTPMVRASATGLTSAEKHLLQVYRCELAQKLREACVRRFDQSSVGNRTFTLQLRNEGRITLSEESDWRASIDRLTHALQRDARSASSFDPQDWTAGSITQVAAAALRLEPTTNARLYVAEDLIIRGELLAARRVVSGAFTCASSTFVDYCFDVMGTICFRLKEYDAARDAYANAASRSMRTSPHICWFTSALQAGDSHEAIRAADAMKCCPESEVEEFLSQIIEPQIARGDWSQSVDSMEATARIADQVPNVARRVLHVLR